MRTEKISHPYVLTADIGGSHITVAVCDIYKNLVVNETLVRTELSSKGTAENILNAWIKAFHVALENFNLPVSALGVAMPGPFDYANGISYITGLNKYEALYEMDIKKHLSKHLRLAPESIKFKNDAEATIAGEVLAGAGIGFKKVLGITLGTGFGSALFDGEATLDLNLGSEPFKDSIADDNLSTRWFLKRYHEISGISVVGVKELAALTGESPPARQVFREFANNLCEFLSPHLKKSDPDLLVICGNIAKAHSLFLPQVKKNLSSTHIKLGQLGEHAALIGAAGLFEYEASMTNTKTVRTLI